MKCRPILVDDSLQELTRHGTGEFPLSMDRQVVSGLNHGGVRHWHHEVQIALVTEGEILFHGEGEPVLLRTGQGFFVNSGVIHEASPAGDGDGVYICVNFQPSLIYGQSASLRDYVAPVLVCEELRTFPLLDEPWHRQICQLMQRLGQVEEAGEYGYELLMQSLLCQIWYLIVAHNRKWMEQDASVLFHDRQRIRVLQTYIHKHYREHITLADIASAGHISRGECCRVFKRVRRISPIQYLTEVRLDQSLRLLTGTDWGMAEIARAVGFGTGSYFAERFRERLGCTPSEYRRQHPGGAKE